MASQMAQEKDTAIIQLKPSAAEERERSNGEAL